MLALALAGCSGPSRPALPELSAADTAACADLVAAAPDSLAGLSREDGDGRTVTWGDPAVTLTCGVAKPAAYDEFAHCIVLREVGWFVPTDELEDVTGPATATALTFTPYVSLHIPGEHRADAVDSMLAELAPAIAKALTPGPRCH